MRVTRPLPFVSALLAMGVSLAQHPDLNISMNAAVFGQQVSLLRGTSSPTQDIQNLRVTLGRTTRPVPPVHPPDRPIQFQG